MDAATTESHAVVTGEWKIEVEAEGEMKVIMAVLPRGKVTMATKRDGDRITQKLMIPANVRECRMVVINGAVVEIVGAAIGLRVLP